MQRKPAYYATNQSNWNIILITWLRPGVITWRHVGESNSTRNCNSFEYQDFFFRDLNFCFKNIICFRYNSSNISVLFSVLKKTNSIIDYNWHSFINKSFINLKISTKYTINRIDSIVFITFVLRWAEPLLYWANNSTACYAAWTAVVVQPCTIGSRF